MASNEKTLLLVYVNPRITIHSMRPGRLRNGYRKGLILWLTLQWLGKLWKSSGSIHTIWLATAFSCPFEAGYPRAGHGWLDEPSFQKQYSSQTRQGEAYRKGRNWIQWYKMTLGLHGDGATFVAPSPIMGAT